MSLHPDNIRIEDFNTILGRYADTIRSLSGPASASKGKAKAGPQETLAELNEYRLDELPREVKQRIQKKQVYLEKSEVEKLIRWKLKHGKFRPTLMSLVSSNSPDVIESTTAQAWNDLTAEPTIASVSSALNTLVTLRGIGPASASLLLSVLAPEDVPFFSDELFRWITASKTGNVVWEKPIKYDKNEYQTLVQGVWRTKKRLGVSAGDVEKVAYVLGKEKASLKKTTNISQEVDDKVGESANGTAELVDAHASATSTKRKSDATPEARPRPSKRGTRSSARG